MIPIVITSKAAKRDVEKIKIHHKAIVEGLVNQAAKLQALKQAQQKQQMVDKKETKDTQMKQSEIDIKRASLVK